MSGQKLKSNIFFIVIILLLYASQLTIIPCFAQAARPINHENPDTVEPIITYKTEIELQVQLIVMIQTSYSTVKCSYDSDFNLSKSQLGIYKNSYDNYKELIPGAKLSSSKYYVLNPIMADCQKDLEIWIKDSESYANNYRNFEYFIAAEDIKSATPYALLLRDSYHNLSIARSSFSNNTMLVTQLLDNQLNTSYLNMSSSLMDRHLKNLSEKEKAVDDLLDRTSLSLAADRYAVRNGETINFTILLKTDGSVPVEGENVNLYVNDRIVATKPLDFNGACTIFYVVPEDTVNRLKVLAEFRPEDRWLVPVNSSRLELLVDEKNTYITMHVQPDAASYGDQIEIKGRLQTIEGDAVPHRKIIFTVNDQNVGNATTMDDGSYRYLYPVTSQTPGGICNIRATYTQDTVGGDIFLGSRSSVYPVTVLTQDTLLTFTSSHNSLIGGDSSEFYGQLMTRGGVPVKDAIISIFDGNRQLITNTTDSDGMYRVGWVVPVDYFDGTNRNHSLYASFSAQNKSLNSASSSRIMVSFGETGPVITANNMSAVLFVNDVFYVRGSVRNSNGNPLAGQQVSIKMSNETIVQVTTDSDGHYNYMKKITMRDSLGLHPVEISIPGSTHYAGTTLVIPFNVIALALIIIIVLPFIVYVFLKLTGLNRLILVRMRRNQAATLKKKRVSKAGIINTPVLEQLPKVEAVNLDAEMATINRLVESGDIKNALSHIFLVIKKIAAYRGIDVKDSMTHREICRMVSSRYVAISRPLRAFIGEYEIVNYGNVEPDRNEMVRSIESLSDIYKGVSSQTGEE
ncbi:MAG: hypothetical protein NC238_16125 [Dehalobacter sp.]|nr:hypothetical protein [Dehalobacter sp.]